MDARDEECERVNSSSSSPSPEDLRMHLVAGMIAGIRTLAPGPEPLGIIGPTSDTGGNERALSKKDRRAVTLIFAMLICGKVSTISNTLM